MLTLQTQNSSIGYREIKQRHVGLQQVMRTASNFNIQQVHVRNQSDSNLRNSNQMQNNHSQKRSNSNYNNNVVMNQSRREGLIDDQSNQSIFMQTKRKGQHFSSQEIHLNQELSNNQSQEDNLFGKQTYGKGQVFTQKKEIKSVNAVTMKRKDSGANIIIQDKDENPNITLRKKEIQQINGQNQVKKGQIRIQDTKADIITLNTDKGIIQEDNGSQLKIKNQFIKNNRKEGELKEAIIDEKGISQYEKVTMIRKENQNNQCYRGQIQNNHLREDSNKENMQQDMNCSQNMLQQRGQYNYETSFQSNGSQKTKNYYVSMKTQESTKQINYLSTEGSKEEGYKEERHKKDEQASLTRRNITSATTNCSGNSEHFSLMPINNDNFIDNYIEKVFSKEDSISLYNSNFASFNSQRNLNYNRSIDSQQVYQQALSQKLKLLPCKDKKYPIQDTNNNNSFINMEHQNDFNKSNALNTNESSQINDHTDQIKEHSQNVFQNGNYRNQDKNNNSYYVQMNDFNYQMNQQHLIDNKQNVKYNNNSKIIQNQNETSTHNKDKISQTKNYNQSDKNEDDGNNTMIESKENKDIKQSLGQQNSITSEVFEYNSLISEKEREIKDLFKRLEVKDDQIMLLQSQIEQLKKREQKDKQTLQRKEEDKQRLIMLNQQFVAKIESQKEQLAQLNAHNPFMDQSKEQEHHSNINESQHIIQNKTEEEDTIRYLKEQNNQLISLNDIANNQTSLFSQKNILLENKLTVTQVQLKQYYDELQILNAQIQQFKEASVQHKQDHSLHLIQRQYQPQLDSLKFTQCLD